MTATTVADVKTFRQSLFDKSMALIDRKGADYNRDQQEAGDTLFNLRVCELLGVVPSTEEGILVRLSDKFMRLISLTKPGREAMVKDESVLDTIADIHNYVDYLGLIWQQRRQPVQQFQAGDLVKVSNEKSPRIGDVRRCPACERSAKGTPVHWQRFVGRDNGVGDEGWQFAGNAELSRDEVLAQNEVRS